MQIIHDPKELQLKALELKRAGKTIGLVPTMGYLHAGHLSLIDIARKEADIVIVSIFVNPTQFGPNEDLAQYPRNFERDSKLCDEHHTDIIFAPPPGAMYPANHSVWVEEISLSRKLCGLSRPIHFRGVTTVVAKLFHLSLADVAVFGQKDAQQALIIRRMVRDLDFPIRIITAPLVRDEDQVALSSRNAYLSPAERERARILSQSLFAAREAIRNGTPIPQVKQTITNAISNKADKVDYVEIYDSETLEDPSSDTSEVLIALAAFFGKTRLIDNLLVSLK